MGWVVWRLKHHMTAFHALDDCNADGARTTDPIALLSNYVGLFLRRHQPWVPASGFALTLPPLSFSVLCLPLRTHLCDVFDRSRAITYIAALGVSLVGCGWLLSAFFVLVHFLWFMGSRCCFSFHRTVEREHLWDNIKVARAVSNFTCGV